MVLATTNILEKTMSDEGRKYNFEFYVVNKLTEVGDTLKTLVGNHADLTTKYFELREQIAIIKTRIAIYSLGFGGVGSILIILVQWLLSKI